MGRPPEGDCSCCGVSEPPPITRCNDVICIAFIDENLDSDGRDTVDAKFAEWTQAFPERILFVVDVFKRDPLEPDGTPKLYFPNGWDDHNYAFNLRGEFLRGVSVPEFCNRDNGDVGQATDVWAALATIATDRGLTTDVNNAKEVSIFVDISGSMEFSDVAAAYNLLVDELESAGKTLVSSVSNQEEDYLCPFVTSNCCPNEFAEPLQVLCEVTPNCEPATWSLENRTVERQSGFGTKYLGRTQLLIREYSDYDRRDPPSPEWYFLYGSVEEYMQLLWGNTTGYLIQETHQQNLILRANAFSSSGQELRFVDIEYKAYYSDDDGDTYTEIGTIGTAKSGFDFKLDVTMDNFGGSSSSAVSVHDWLGATIDNATGNYEDVRWGASTTAERRLYDRKIKIEANPLDPSLLGTLAVEFTLFEYFNPGLAGPDDPPPNNQSEFSAELILPCSWDGVANNITFANTPEGGLQDIVDDSKIPWTSIANLYVLKQVAWQVATNPSKFELTGLKPVATNEDFSPDGFSGRVSITLRDQRGRLTDALCSLTSELQIPMQITGFYYDGTPGSWDIPPLEYSLPRAVTPFQEIFSANQTDQLFQYGRTERGNKSPFGGWERGSTMPFGYFNTIFNSRTAGQWASTNLSSAAGWYGASSPFGNEDRTEWAPWAGGSSSQELYRTPLENYYFAPRRDDPKVLSLVSQDQIDNWDSLGIPQDARIQIGPFFNVKHASSYTVKQGVDCKFYSLLNVRRNQRDPNGSDAEYTLQSATPFVYQSTCRYTLKITPTTPLDQLGVVGTQQQLTFGYFFPKLVLMLEDNLPLTFCRFLPLP